MALLRLQTYLIACFLLLAVAIVLIWSGQERLKQFQDAQQESQGIVADHAATLITALLQNQQERLHLFTTENLTTIEQLAANPNQPERLQLFQHRVKQHFPDHLTFTIANREGKPLLQDIDMLVGEICQQDLREFSAQVQHFGNHYKNETYIHPQPGYYHYDVIAPWRSEALEGLFFVSFRPQAMIEYLKNAQIPGSRLLLVSQKQPALIEVSAMGSRDNPHQPMHLSPEELKSMTMSKSIPNSRWRLLVLADTAPEQALRQHLWQTSFWIMGMVLITVLLLLAIFWRALR